MDRLKAYLAGGNKAVQGWLAPEAMQAVTQLARLQSACGIRGPVCEIGIHHGKLFILLALLTQAGEPAVAWDLFERQAENVDRSGAGNKEVFERNLRRHGCDLGRVRVHTANSMELSADGVLQQCGGQPRIFSIDGGHTPEITCNDLALADRTLCQGGLLVLDDFFNEAWPGVAEGTCRYFFETRPRLVPVAIVGNKLLFAKDAEFARRYREQLAGQRWDWFTVTTSTLFEQPVLTIIPRTRTLRARLTGSRLWKLMRGTPAGRIIRLVAAGASRH